MNSSEKRTLKKGADKMDSTVEFERVKQEFSDADVDRKVQLYVTAEGLTQEQYKDLLSMFPSDQLGLLEQALM